MTVYKNDIGHRLDGLRENLEHGELNATRLRKAALYKVTLLLIADVVLAILVLNSYDNAWLILFLIISLISTGSALYALGKAQSHYELCSSLLDDFEKYLIDKEATDLEDL